MVSWLEDRLRAFHGGLVMVTHDRYFLERVVTRIAELSRAKLTYYEANYSKYLELKAASEQMQAASERKRQTLLRREREWIRASCRARTTKSKGPCGAVSHPGCRIASCFRGNRAGGSSDLPPGQANHHPGACSGLRR